MNLLQGVSKSINEILSDSRIVQKVGIIFGINFILHIISLILQVIAITSTLTSGSGIGEEFDPTYIFASFVLPIFVQLLTLPVWLYIKGYTYQIANNIRAENTLDILPEHDNPKRTLSFGGIYLTISYTLTIPLAIASILPVMFALNMSTEWLISSGIEVFLGLYAGLIFAAVGFGTALFIINSVIVPCLIYVYLKKKSLIAAYNAANVFRVISASWKQWLLVIGISLAMNVVISILNLVLCCMGPIIIPLTQTLAVIVTGTLIGLVYNNLDKEINI
ncbi:MAG: DUF4013 domain-containing protein [Patescibacteria group bacterium]|nr:DUF4013 domain-containing protein [Patescibacteria group bacterium]